MRRLRSGDRVVARIPEETIHLFDGATGEALHNREFDDDHRIEEPLD